MDQIRRVIIKKLIIVNCADKLINGNIYGNNYFNYF